MWHALCHSCLSKGGRGKGERGKGKGDIVGNLMAALRRQGSAEGDGGSGKGDGGSRKEEGGKGKGEVQKGKGGKGISTERLCAVTTKEIQELVTMRRCNSGAHVKRS